MIYVVMATSWDGAEDWIIGVYTDKDVARRLAKLRPRRHMVSVELDRVPLLDRA